MRTKATAVTTISPSIAPRENEIRTAWIIRATHPNASPFCHNRPAASPMNTPSPAPPRHPPDEQAGGDDPAVVALRHRPVPQVLGPDDGEADVDQQPDVRVEQGGGRPAVRHQVGEDESHQPLRSRPRTSARPGGS